MNYASETIVVGLLGGRSVRFDKFGSWQDGDKVAQNLIRYIQMGSQILLSAARALLCRR